MNVDQAEIGKFDALAARWWDPEGEFKPLHDINPVRLNYLMEHCDIRSRPVVDVGCGGGILAESLAREGATVTGIDMAESPLAVARLHAEDSGVQVEYLATTAEDLAAERAGRFGTVACLEMLEHVPDYASTVKACADLAAPDGKLVFSTINRNPKAYLFAIVGAEYLLRMLPKGTHEFSKFIRPSELEGWTRHAGLELNELTGMVYNPFSQQYSLGRDLDVNYLAHCTRPSSD